MSYPSFDDLKWFLLRYANRAKNIKNKATINEDPKDALLREFQNEIEKLKKQLDDGNYLFLSFFHACIFVTA